MWLGSLATNSVLDVGPASVMVGNIVQGNRLASAQGRDMGIVDEESDSARKVILEFIKIDYRVCGCQWSNAEDLFLYVNLSRSPSN